MPCLSALQAAHAMVRCLAGSLAMVTCKEPLRSALAQHLRQLLQVCSFAHDELIVMHIGQSASCVDPPIMLASCCLQSRPDLLASIHTFQCMHAF
jgi:hypothetical protein